ncbi:MAG: nicotinamide mononucleotide transporter [Spirochaetales bacterium]|nr:nicotinamide mononucleotide transporter [Spirochaetales bacterium]
MNLILTFFDINTIAISILGYNLSWVELIGTSFGFWCVYLTAKEKILCWPIGIVNIIFFFILFYQVQLYSDMLLQFIFFVMSIFGWWKWTHPRKESLANSKRELKISDLAIMEFLIWIGLSTIAVMGLGFFMTQIHLISPLWFPEPAAYSFADAYTTVFSISAQIIMALKKRQCWLFWIAVDLVACVVYFLKGINFVAIEYIFFTIIAYFGYMNWTKETRAYQSPEPSL